VSRRRRRRIERILRKRPALIMGSGRRCRQRAKRQVSVLHLSESSYLRLEKRIAIMPLAKLCRLEELLMAMYIL
jgi:hypothetical protein